MFLFLKILEPQNILILFLILWNIFTDLEYFNVALEEYKVCVMMEHMITLQKMNLMVSESLFCN